jgi:ADP-ribose pyrophosphatase YjhB (NUDIX family)
VIKEEKNMADKVVPTIAVIIYKGNEVLLIRHGEKANQQTGVYSLPGGVVESNENHIQAAIRELMEETHLKTTPDDLIEIPKYYSARIERKNETKVYSMRAYVCNKYSGNKVIGIEDETFPEWKKIEDLPNLNLLPNIREAVKEGLNI